MRIQVLTAYNDAFLPIAKMTVPLLREFAARHGHDFHVSTDMDAGSLNTIWAKISLINEALENSGAEFVFWIDSDALMLRPDRDIRDSIVDQADLHMTWHSSDTGRSDWHVPNPHYNAGVMLVRNSAWSRDFFARVWELRFAKHHSWNDQAVILQLLGYRKSIGLGDDIEHVPDRGHVAHLDCEWNSIPGGVMADDPIIHHYAGMANEDRARLIALDIKYLAERRGSAAFREAISHQISLWAADVRRRRNEMSERAWLATEIERLNREAADLERDPRALLKRLPRAVRLRLARVLSD